MAYITCIDWDIKELEYNEDEGCNEVLIGDDAWIEFREEGGKIEATAFLIIGNESQLRAFLGSYDDLDRAFEAATYKFSHGIDSYKWIVDYV